MLIHDTNIQFISQLNKENLLNLWIFYDKIKYHELTKGGFVYLSDLKSIASDLNIPYNTFRQKILMCKRKGLLIKKFTGYEIKSWKRLVEEMDVPKFKKIRIKGEDKVDLMKQVSLRLIDLSLKQQFYAKYRLFQPGPLRKKRAAVLKGKEFTVSTYFVAENLGYKSATTGTRYERLLKDDGHIKIYHNAKMVCDYRDFNNVLLSDPELKNRFYYYKGKIYERQCNNIILN